MKIVHVKWEDSVGVSPGWVQINEPPETEVLICESVGFLLWDRERSITVLPHFHDSDEGLSADKSGCGDMTIPKSCILEMTVLKGEEGAQ